jgi:hypothetical protein
MNRKPCVFGVLALAAFSAGAFLPAAADGSAHELSSSPFLTELHIHGSLSEGRASMWHHSKIAALANYDVLWWTDHMERVSSTLFPQSIDFNNGSFSGSFSGGQLGFIGVGEVTKSIPNNGNAQHAHFVHTPSSNSNNWSAGGLQFATTGNFERMSLMADPTLVLNLRLANNANANFTSMVVRVTLSSKRGDGSDDIGIRNILEYVPQGMPFPDLDPSGSTNTVQLRTLGLQQSSYTTLTLHPQADALQHFQEGDDLSIVKIEILAAAKKGRTMEVDLDDFSLRVLAAHANKELLIAAEDRVQNSGPPYSDLTQYVGMEIGGPNHQGVNDIGTRDHIVALYRDPIGSAIEEIYDYVSPQFPAVQWPQDGIEDIHEDDGVAILAHLFSAAPAPELLDLHDLQALASRVLTHDAWGADGIEIGYEIRGAPMTAFIQVWDRLSQRGTYITGVGVSDNHSVQDPQLRENHMGTWLRASSDSSEDLADAVESGHAFFGDPFRFDPQGDLEFGEIHGAFGMGDVVVIAPGQTRSLGVSIHGGNFGDTLVWFLNGEATSSKPFTAQGTVDSTVHLALNPGDWVRVEVHTAADRLYLLSNPIYFVENASEIPPARDSD